MWIKNRKEEVLANTNNMGFITILELEGDKYAVAGYTNSSRDPVILGCYSTRKAAKAAIFTIYETIKHGNAVMDMPSNSETGDRQRRHPIILLDEE